MEEDTVKDYVQWLLWNLSWNLHTLQWFRKVAERHIRRCYRGSVVLEQLQILDFRVIIPDLLLIDVSKQLLLQDTSMKKSMSFKSVKVLVKASTGMTASIFSVMVVFISKPLLVQMRKFNPLWITCSYIYPKFLQGLGNDWIWEETKWREVMIGSCGFWSFNLQELKIKKPRYPYLTEEDKEGMRMVIDKFVRKIDHFSETDESPCS